jgi:hypothetical protein
VCVVFREGVGGGLVGLVGQVGPLQRSYDPHAHAHHLNRVKDASTPAPESADQSRLTRQDSPLEYNLLEGV